MELETERLILRSFREEDVDIMAQLFANPDFMRFSLGVFTERKQTIAFIEKVMAWDRARIPSQFAVVQRGEDVIIGYCGFFYHLEHGIEDIEIRALWTDNVDNLVFAGSTWGNDQSRSPSLPAFFVLDCTPITGTAASLPKPRVLSVTTAFATGSCHASFHSFIPKTFRHVAWPRKMG